jgi:hypothetical protein
MAAAPKIIPKLSGGQGREALHLRLVDRAVALQPADRPPAAHDAAERLRVGVLQGGLLQLQHAPRSQGRHRLREDGAVPVVPRFLRNTLGYSTHARVSLPVLNPKTGINRDFDSVPVDGPPQRHGGDAADHEVRHDRPSSTCSTSARRTTPTPSRRGQLDVAAHQRRQRRLQEDGRGRRRPGQPGQGRRSSSTRTSWTSCASARSTPCATSTACSRSSTTCSRRTPTSSSPPTTASCSAKWAISATARSCTTSASRCLTSRARSAALSHASPHFPAFS